MDDKVYSLKVDINPIAKKGTQFILREGYFVNEDESISIKTSNSSAKLFKHEKGR